MHECIEDVSADGLDVMVGFLELFLEIDDLFFKYLHVYFLSVSALLAGFVIFDSCW